MEMFINGSRDKEMAKQSKDSLIMVTVSVLIWYYYIKACKEKYYRLVILDNYMS